MAAEYGDQPRPLSEIIGATTLALLRAEADAGRATLDFIEQFGFEADPEREGLGRLRMVEFTRERVDPSGVPEVVRTSVPLLSLLPIPSSSIKRATIHYSVRVTGVQPVRQETSEEKERPRRGAMARPPSVEMYGSILPGDPNDAGFVKIEIEAGPADVSSGLTRLMQAMDSSIHDRQAEPEGKRYYRKVRRE